MDVGRKQERPLIVFGRYMRIACERKAKVLGITRYPWRRLSQESNTSYSVLTKAVVGEDVPEPENVWKWIDTLAPGLELECLICHSLRYATRQEAEEAEQRIDTLEQEEQKNG